jgi:hypothetical protein
MFDTVTLIANGVEVNPNKLEQCKQFTYIGDDGGYRTKLKYRKGNILYVYKLQQQILEIECSIPKLVYGTNVYSISIDDIAIFWNRLNEALIEYLGVEIQKEHWKVKRLDISYNFLVDNVGSYITELGMLNISKRKKVIYNENETVIFKNKTSSICFYDKEKECLSRKEESDIVDKAKGILRLEVRPAYYHMRDYSPSRKATDLLSMEYFSFIIEKLGINQFLESIDYHKVDCDKSNLQNALEEMKATDIEKVIGFTTLINTFGEKVLLESGYYKGGTFRNRRELVDQFFLITTKGRPKQKRISVPLSS